MNKIYRNEKPITLQNIIFWVCNFFTVFIHIICLCTVLSAIILGFSYASYLKDRAAYDSIISQYKQSITLYNGNIIIDVDHVITDLRYTGNTEQVSLLVQQLREQVVDYNRSIIIKRRLKNNFMFGMLIINPDKDMVPINILTQPSRK